METPSSSSRRVTRSQTFAAVKNSDHVSSTRENKERIEESGKGATKSRQQTTKKQDRSALIDITNDSPIVGLAMGKLETPSSNMSKKRVIAFGKQEAGTPGSGEALLRGQVKTLLQKVEEEAHITKFISIPRPFLRLEGQSLDSPIGLFAPTPANTPQIISNPSAIGSVNSIGLASILECGLENEISSPQGESEKDLMVTRSLLLDFSEKSEGSYSSEVSSTVTYQEGESDEKYKKATAEDDDSSIWSIQVNASSKDEHDTDEDEIEEEANNDDDYYYQEEEEEEENGDAGLVDDLCERISKINVNGNGKAKFCGKHIKFVYNSDDELEGEEVLGKENESAAASVSPGAIRLQGWPSPKGKHIRFDD